jgi:hypothetical protein
MRGDCLGGRKNRGSIVSPWACEFLVTASLKQSPRQTVSHLESNEQGQLVTAVYAKLALACQLCVPKGYVAAQNHHQANSFLYCAPADGGTVLGGRATCPRNASSIEMLLLVRICPVDRSISTFARAYAAFAVTSFDSASVSACWS